MTPVLVGVGRNIRSATGRKVLYKIKSEPGDHKGSPLPCYEIAAEVNSSIVGEMSPCSRPLESLEGNMRKSRTDTSELRLAALMAALSFATDLGMAQPLEYVLCLCVLAVRLGERSGLSESELREVYYLALLRIISLLLTP